MNILVTGGTGFVGSHTVAALQEAGDSVRLIVRSPERTRDALAPLGIAADAVDIVPGDVTDPASIRAALSGCDAMVHAASVYSLDVRRRAEVMRTNVMGSRLVLELAVEAGLDPVVHVSSISAMLDRSGVLTPDTPPGRPRGAYSRSKADADRVARHYQERGAPVVITYPASVWGPHDPHLGESSRSAIAMLKGTYRISPPGGIIACDVRDVATLHAAVMRGGLGPRRYFAPAVMVEFTEWVRRFASLTGRPLRTTPLPAELILPPMRALDGIRRFVPLPSPVDYEGAFSLSRFAAWDHWDDRRTRDEFGLDRPDIDLLFAETIRWLHEQGHISDEQAGQMAGWRKATRPHVHGPPGTD